MHRRTVFVSSGPIAPLPCMLSFPCVCCVLRGRSIDASSCGLSGSLPNLASSSIGSDSIPRHSCAPLSLCVVPYLLLLLLCGTSGLDLSLNKGITGAIVPSKLPPSL